MYEGTDEIFSEVCSLYFCIHHFFSRLKVEINDLRFLHDWLFYKTIFKPDVEYVNINNLSSFRNNESIIGVISLEIWYIVRHARVRSKIRAVNSMSFKACKPGSS